MRSTETGSAGIALQNALRKLYTASAKPTLTGTAPFARDVGTVELVRETTDVIERLCIEAALELTGDNRASAAEMLGLSRQSLYSKLRRFGLGQRDADADSGNYR